MAWDEGWALPLPFRGMRQRCSLSSLQLTDAKPAREVVHIVCRGAAQIECFKAPMSDFRPKLCSMSSFIRLAAVVLLGGGIFAPLVPVLPSPLYAQDKPEEKPSGQDEGSEKPDDQAEAKEAENRAKARDKAIQEYEEAAKKLPPRAGAPECVWTGRRISSLLWRDDLGTAARYMDLYEEFGCSPEHMKLAFRCVIKQGPIDPKAAEELASRVHNCWISPDGPKKETSEAANSTKNGTKPE